MGELDKTRQTDSDGKVTLCIKISKNLLKKIDEVKGISRSEFVRKAIIEKLNSSENTTLKEITLLRNKINSLEKRVKSLEIELKSRSVSEPLSEDSLYRFCRDDKDRKIISILRENGYVKTTDLETVLGLKRRQITNRLKRLALVTKAIEFVPGYRNGIKKAWWLIVENK